MECKCVFCIVPPCSNSGRDTLPTPVLVVDSSCTFWAWLTSVVPVRLLLTTKRNSPPLTFDSFDSAALFVGKGKKRKSKGRCEEEPEEGGGERQGRSVSKTDQIHVFVKTTEGLCDLTKFAGFRGEGGITNGGGPALKGRNAPPLELMGDSCVCTRALPRKLLLSSERNEQASKRRRRKNDEQLDDVDRVMIKETTQIENTTTQKRSSHTTLKNNLQSQPIFDPLQSENTFHPLQSENTFHPLQSENTFHPLQSENTFHPLQSENTFHPLQSENIFHPLQSTFDPLQSYNTLNPLSSSSPSSFPSVRLKMHYPTDETVARLGGCPDKVRYIVESRDVWDEEVVEELIRWGARPELHSVGDTVQRRWFTSVDCTFVQPNGRLVPHVWLSLDYLKQDYPAHVAHLD